MKKKNIPKEVFYIKAGPGHYKFIETNGIKSTETRLTDKVEKFDINKSIIDGYLGLNGYKLVSRAEINKHITDNQLPFRLPEVQLSLHFQQGKLF